MEKDFEVTAQDREQIFPEARDTVEEVFNRIKQDTNYTLGKYGHAAGGLATFIYRERHLSHEEQRQKLKELAQKIVQKHGEGILKVLRPELREALGIPAAPEK